MVKYHVTPVMRGTTRVVSRHLITRFVIFYRYNLIIINIMIHASIIIINILTIIIITIIGTSLSEPHTYRTAVQNPPDIYIYIYVVVRERIKSTATHYIAARYSLRVLYQLPMSVISETGLNRFLGR